MASMMRDAIFVRCNRRLAQRSRKLARVRGVSLGALVRELLAAAVRSSPDRADAVERFLLRGK